MKRTDTIIRIMSALILTALLCYVGVYLFRSLHDPLRTAEALDMTVRESASASGIVIRDELIVETSRKNLDISAAEGVRVAKGAEIAVSYGSAEAVARASRLRELELEIMRVRTLLSTLTTAEDISARDAAVRSAIYDFTWSVARRELGELDSLSLRLRSLVFANKDEMVTAEDLGALESEYWGLAFASDVDMIPIVAPEAGVYTSIVDGYEHLSYDGTRYLTLENLRELMDSHEDVSDSAIGKLVASSSWYFACVMDEEPAARLKELDDAGKPAVLEFGRYYSSSVKAEVLSIGAVEDGECAVVFSCAEALVETLAMRHVAADVIYAEYSGIRVPTEALYEDEDGTMYIYTLTGLQAERKDVDIVYEAEGFYLVKSGTQADSLRSGNKIIVGAKNLYDGKVVG